MGTKDSSRKAVSGYLLLAIVLFSGLCRVFANEGTGSGTQDLLNGLLIEAVVDKVDVRSATQLLEKGADPNADTSHIQRPSLVYVAAIEHTGYLSSSAAEAFGRRDNPMFEVLLDHGAEFRESTLPCLLAARGGLYELSYALENGHITIDYRNPNDKRTLLICALGTNDADTSAGIVRWLLPRGVDVLAEDAEGKTALDHIKKVLTLDRAKSNRRGWERVEDLIFQATVDKLTDQR